MNPLEYISKGIKKGNWQDVCKGYELLTGESLSIPEIPNNDVDAKNILIEVMNMISQFFDDGVIDTTKVTKKKSGSTKKRKKKSAKKLKGNSSNDDGTDPSITLNETDKTPVQKETGGVRLITNEPDPEEVEQNKRKAKKVMKNKVQLQRKSIETYKVKCNECEKEFESDRPDGEVGQKCKTCLNDKKSRFS